MEKQVHKNLEFWFKDKNPLDDGNEKRIIKVYDSVTGVVIDVKYKENIKVNVNFVNYIIQMVCMARGITTMLASEDHSKDVYVEVEDEEVS